MCPGQVCSEKTWEGPDVSLLPDFQGISKQKSKAKVSYKRRGWVLKPCPNTHSLLCVFFLLKISFFFSFSFSSSYFFLFLFLLVLLLSVCLRCLRNLCQIASWSLRLQWPYMTKNTNFTKISAEKSLNHQKQEQPVKPKSDFQSSYITVFKTSSFQQKITRHAKIEESMAHTYGKKEINRNCLWGSPDIELTRQALNQSFEICSKI